MDNAFGEDWDQKFEVPRLHVLPPLDNIKEKYQQVPEWLNPLLFGTGPSFVGQRTILIHGPPGFGKTTLAQHWFPGFFWALNRKMLENFDPRKYVGIIFDNMNPSPHACNGVGKGERWNISELLKLCDPKNFSGNPAVYIPAGLPRVLISHCSLAELLGRYATVKPPKLLARKKELLALAGSIHEQEFTERIMKDGIAEDATKYSHSCNEQFIGNDVELNVYLKYILKKKKAKGKRKKALEQQISLKKQKLALKKQRLASKKQKLALKKQKNASKKQKNSLKQQKSNLSNEEDGFVDPALPKRGRKKSKKSLSSAPVTCPTGSQDEFSGYARRKYAHAVRSQQNFRSEHSRSEAMGSRSEY